MDRLKALLFFTSAALCLDPRPALAALTIERALSDTEILIRATAGEKLELEDRLTAFSRARHEVSGTCRIIGFEPGGPGYVARVEAHSQNRMIVPGDTLTKVDLRGADPDYLGRADLLASGHISARYKPLIYRGIGIGETAATLEKGENILDMIGFYSRGITDRLTLSTYGVIDLVGAPNFLVKYRVWDREGITVTPEAEVLYSPALSVGTFISNIYFDTASNSKLISHTTVTLAAAFGGAQSLANTPTANALFASSIDSGYEYIRDNWDRVLIGPKYTFATQSLGGHLAYMFIWDRFHFSIDLTVTDITKLTLGGNGYVPYVYLYWRFR